MLWALAQVCLISALELLKPWPLTLIIDSVLGGAPLPWGLTPDLGTGALLRENIAFSRPDARMEEIIAAAKAAHIIITHRLSTVPTTDLIVVIKDGRIVEQGTLAELVEHRGAFAAMYGGPRRQEDLLAFP
jgi:ABC-type protease/lipase transport system fused ATPase/permease subunit